MKITKYEHACLSVEANGRVLVIDPGVYSAGFVPSDNIDAVVVTHEHSDHFDPEKVARITALNPNVVIFTTEKVATGLPKANVPDGDKKLTVGNFLLQFFGHDHAPIVGKVVPCDNFGVVVNDTLIYPGDSFSLLPNFAETATKILAAPASAPWLKVNEVLEYIATVRPTLVFPTHNALLSQIGRDITYSWLRPAATEAGAEFVDLSPGESWDV